MTITRAMYGGTIFLSAFLLFAVEPMAAKHLLPTLGGSSAVWVTCLVFFQGMLLIGYLYAHWMSRHGKLRVHLGLLVAAMLVLAGVVVAGSSGLDVHSSSDVALHPVRTIFLALGATIGLPFLILGSTSPLLQVWLARIEGGNVSYHLFALSNVGSLLALVLYPTLIEPYLTLASQRETWIAGFGIYAVVCGSLAWRVNREGKSTPSQADEATAPHSHSQAFIESAGIGRKCFWFLLPMAAAMQLSSVTSHLSQDVAAIPMLWVLPLGVYLITFILAFEVPGFYRRWLVIRMLAVMLASLGYALSKVDTTLPIGLAILFYLVEIFIACWFCHAETYSLRPQSAEESTIFYFYVAGGGVVGTFLIAILSPLVFRVNCDLAISFLVTAALAAAVTWRDGWAQRLLWLTGSALLLALAILLHIQFGHHSLLQARNFYGSLRVTQADIDPGSEGNDTGEGGVYSRGTGPIRTLMNGRIRHGTQMQEVDRRRTPTTYYAQNSGVGIAIRYCCDARPKSIGVIGLGVGTLAAYGNSGDRIRFYEINPLVEPVARNLFTYIRDSPAQISVIPGDGRASLARELDQQFDVLVVDAFSGDAIPLHLLTREAMEIYRNRLTPNGIIAFHVSNSYLNLAPEVARLAASAGMQARVFDTPSIPAKGEYRATWVLVSGDEAFFRIPAVIDASTPIPGIAGLRLWTDDYSSLLSVMRWR